MGNNKITKDITIDYGGMSWSVQNYKILMAKQLTEIWNTTLKLV